jgi:hypothetical protein
MDTITKPRSQADTGLSPGEIREFFDTGWIRKDALFHEHEVRKMKRCFDALERAAGTLTETGVVWAGASQPYLLKIGADRRLTVPCSQLLDSNILEQLLNQAHFKRPGDGVIFGWHQDIQHRDKGPGTWEDINGRGSFVQSLVVIDEMTADSGPLMFLPGSCQWGRVDFGDHDYDDPDYTPKSPPQFRAEDAVTIQARPGDTLFFGPYTAHASFENTSPHYRRVLINGYAYPGANKREYPGEGSCRTIRT